MVDKTVPLDKLAKSPNKDGNFKEESVESKKETFLQKLIKNASSNLEKARNEFNKTIKPLEESADRKEKASAAVLPEVEDNNFQEKRKKKLYDNIAEQSKNNCSRLSESIYGSVKPLFDHISSFLESISGFIKPIGKITGKLFTAFWDKTVGKLFGVLKNYGGFLFDFALKAAIGIFGVIGWIYTGARKALGFVYDTLVTLAKFGWEIISLAFDVLNEASKSILSIMYNSLIAILTNPISLLVMGFAFYIYRKEILAIFGKIFDWAWEGVKTIVSDIFFGGDKTKMQDFFTKTWDQVVNFIMKDVWPWIKEEAETYLPLISATLSKWIGPGWDYILSTFGASWAYIKSKWNTIVDFFETTLNPSLLDQIYILVNAIKRMVYGEKRLKIDAQKKENDTRLREALAYQIKNNAQMNVESNMLETLKLITEGPDKKDKLISNGEVALQKYVQNISKYLSKMPEYMTYILPKLDLDIPSLADSILSMSTTERAEKSSSLINSLKENDLLIDEIMSISTKQSEWSPELVTEKINEAIFRTEGNVIDNALKVQKDQSREYKEQMVGLFGKGSEKIIDETFSELDKNLFVLKQNIITSSQYSENFIKSNAYLMNTVAKYRNKKSSNPDEDKKKFLNALKEYKELVENPFISTLSYPKLTILINNLLQKENVPFRITEDDTFNTFRKQAAGGIIKQPTRALIAEAGYPEMVIPLNSEGMTFIYDSMKDFVIKEYEKTPLDKRNEVVKRIKKGTMEKPDIKLYDMKNLSTNVVRIK